MKYLVWLVLNKSGDEAGVSFKKGKVGLLDRALKRHKEVFGKLAHLHTISPQK